MTPTQEQKERIDNYPVNAVVYGILKSGELASTLCGDKKDILEAI